LSFSAGVGALTAIITTLQSGDGIISTRDLYGGTIRLFRDLATKMGIEVQYVDFDDLKSLEKAFKANTKIVWMETPTNPLMKVLDVKAIADVVHKKSEAYLVVDNTFLTSYFQRPLELGADVVMYSLNKFMNGHHDVVMGAVTTNDEKIYENLNYYQISTGLIPSPFDCHMVSRSLKTLPVRMEKHSKNSFAVAEFLAAHPKVEKVFHPSLKTHKNHEIALKQSYGHSGILSFYIKGKIEQAQKFFSSLKLVLNAESLGGVESTVSYPWLMSHSDMPENERIAAGVTQSLIRLSVGLEDVEEIIDDLDQALKGI
jgi:cystathionine gamma-lyase